MAKPTIREIAMELLKSEDIDFFDIDHLESSPSDSLLADESYSEPFVANAGIAYEKEGLRLEIDEVCAYLLDEDGDKTDEMHTLDYLWAVLDDTGECQTENGTTDPEKIKEVIRNFMA